MRRVLLVVGAILLLSGSATQPLPEGARATALESVTAQRPNILFIITDDQRLDNGMAVMPKTLQLFRQGGTEFTNFYDTTPLCCPSRGSFWSGRYAHNHGVLTNGDHPAELQYDQTTAIQYYLKNAGYTTAIAGKYWNTWPVSTPPPSYDQWATFGGGYNDATFNVNGVVNTVPGYTTDVTGNFAVQFLQSFEQNDPQPWFLYVAPQAPHSDYTPAPKYANAPVPAWSGNPAVFETDKSDKPQPVKNRTNTFQQGDARRTAQLRTLMSVDDMVQQIFDELDLLGETQDTLAIFTTDNGFMWAEHGIIDKRFPYTQSTQLPFFLRWPGHVATGATDDRLTANIDVEPTLLQAAGITPAHVIDGASLFTTDARDRLLLEYFKSPDSPLPSWSSDLTPTYQYVEWYDVTTGAITFREYYDLVNDPWQLTNLLADGNPSNDPNVTALHAQLTADRTCAGSSCPQPVSPDTQAPTVPGKPSGTSTTPGQIDLTWAASSDDRATTITYRVYRDGGSTPVGTVLSSSTTTVGFADTGLAPGSSHTYQVDASDGTNTSALSPASDPITVVSPPPVVFSDSFSSGFGAWSPVVNLTLDNTMGGASPPSAKAAPAGVKAFARTTLAQAYSSLCMSEAINLSSIGTASAALLKLRAGSLSVARILVMPNRVLRVRNDTTGAVFNTGRPLATGWHTVDLCVAIGTSGSISAGLDGTSIGSWSAQNLGTTPISGLQILDESAKTYTANVDDVVAHL